VSTYLTLNLLSPITVHIAVPIKSFMRTRFNLTEEKSETCPLCSAPLAYKLTLTLSGGKELPAMTRCSNTSCEGHRDPSKMLEHEQHLRDITAMQLENAERKKKDLGPLSLTEFKKEKVKHK
jgi:hypothetical protein